MKNYSFLFKPAFYIFSLVFATWMVIKIDSISPSDFGGSNPSDHKKIANAANILYLKQYIFNACEAYKTGKIDRKGLEDELNAIVKLSRNIPTK